MSMRNTRIPRLFVDCDDTLVLWPEKPAEGSPLYYGDKYTLNVALMNAIAEVADEYADVIIWSGGGKDYASMWARRLGWEDWVRSMAKDINAPIESDICIDDQPIKVRATLLTPDEFIARATERNNGQITNVPPTPNQS